MRRLEGCTPVIAPTPTRSPYAVGVDRALVAAVGVRLHADRRQVGCLREEFPATRSSGAAAEAEGEVVWVEGRTAEALLAPVGDRTAVVCASRVSYLDGAVLDVDALVAGCRARGAMSVLDDYHGSGVVPLDVHANGCDALVGGPLKYLLGGPGGGVPLRPGRLVESLRPTITGWFAQADFFAFDGSTIDWPATAQRFAMGTPAPASIFAAAAGLEIVLEVGVERIRTRGARAHRPRWPGRPSRLSCAPVPPRRAGGMVAIEVPDSKRCCPPCWPRGSSSTSATGALRCAPHFSTEEELDALFAALRRLGWWRRSGQRVAALAAEASRGADELVVSHGGEQVLVAAEAHTGRLRAEQARWRCRAALASA
jgi:selenocysteine lyase/cysteine desulfurase